MRNGIATSALVTTSKKQTPRHEQIGYVLMETLEGAERLIRVVPERFAQGHGGLDELAKLVAIHRLVADAIDAAARRLLDAEDASFGDVGTALGITQQAVSARYPGASRRLRGGQGAGR
jgi:hypothetical protein